MTARLAPATLLLAAALAGCAAAYEDRSYGGYGYDGGHGYYGGYGYGRAMPYGYYRPYYNRRDHHYFWPYLYYLPHDRDRLHRHDRGHDRWRDRRKDGAPPPAAEPQPPLQTGPGVIEPASPGRSRHQGRAGLRPEHPLEAGPPPQPPGRGQPHESRAPRFADRQSRPILRESADLQTGDFPLDPANPRRQQSQR